MFPPDTKKNEIDTALHRRYMPRVSIIKNLTIGTNRFGAVRSLFAIPFASTGRQTKLFNLHVAKLQSVIIQLKIC